jgi:hypothetical protein
VGLGEERSFVTAKQDFSPTSSSGSCTNGSHGHSWQDHNDNVSRSPSDGMLPMSLSLSKDDGGTLDVTSTTHSGSMLWTS